MPVWTVPKSKLVGFADIVPAASPVPVSGTVTELSEALLVIEIVPVNAPAALGEKTRLTGVLCPTSSAVGRLGEVNEKDWFEKDALLTVTEDAPVLVAVMVSVLVPPTATEPKSRLAAPSDKVPAPVCVCELVLTPAQPDMSPRHNITNANLLARLHCATRAVRKHFISLSKETRHNWIQTTAIHIEFGLKTLNRTDCKGTWT